jgi:Neutral/alkaline non-lysosomal ceramidase, N-terminal
LSVSYPDEFESTRIIADRQFEKAVELFNSASEEINGKIDSRHIYVNFSQLEVAIISNGKQEMVKTCPAAMGFAFAAGTTDGPGAFDFTQGDDTVSIYYTSCFSIFKFLGHNTDLHMDSCGPYFNLHVVLIFKFSSSCYLAHEILQWTLVVLILNVS